MLSDYPFFPDLTLPDQLRLAALEGQGVLPPGMVDAIQRAADLLEDLGWAVQPKAWGKGMIVALVGTVPRTYRYAIYPQ